MCWICTIVYRYVQQFVRPGEPIAFLAVVEHVVRQFRTYFAEIYASSSLPSLSSRPVTLWGNNTAIFSTLPATASWLLILGLFLQFMATRNYAGCQRMSAAVSKSSMVKLWKSLKRLACFMAGTSEATNPGEATSASVRGNSAMKSRGRM